MGTFSDPETKYENPEQGKNVRDTQKSRVDQDKEEENEPMVGEKMVLLDSWPSHQFFHEKSLPSWFPFTEPFSCLHGYAEAKF